MRNLFMRIDKWAKIMQNLSMRIDKWTKLCGIYLYESINGQKYAEFIYANR